MTNHNAYDGYLRWKAWDSQSFGEFSKADAAYFASEMRAAGQSTHPPLRILEIGFGQGRFARWAIAQGHEYVGTEILPELVASAQTAGITTIAPSEIKNRVPASSLDLVVAFDVLEHLELSNILDHLRLFRELLKPGGCVLARIPSGDSPFGRATQYGDITHRVVLGSFAIGQIAELSGLTVRRISAPTIPLLGVGIKQSIRRLGIKLLQDAITGLIRMTFHFNCKTVVNASMVFVLSRPLDAIAPANSNPTKGNL